MLVLNPNKPSIRNSSKARGKHRLTAKQESFARLVAIHGVPQRQAYIASYRTDGMQPNSITAEASRMAGHAGIAARIEALRAEMVQVDLHDRAETQSFVLKGLKQLALDADTSASKIRAYELLGKCHHVGLFNPPDPALTAGQRSADDIKALLQQRLVRLLPAPGE